MVSAEDDGLCRGRHSQFHKELVGWISIVRVPSDHSTVANNVLTSEDECRCALIHHHRPDLLNYAELDTSPTAAVKNTLIAFRIAERSLGIPVESLSLLTRVECIAHT